MASFVYILGALVAFLCGVLLMRAFLRTRMRLLLWSSLCFLGLTISNVLVFVDLVVFPEKDFYLLRLATAAMAMLFLLYGLIWEGK